MQKNYLQSLSHPLYVQLNVKRIEIVNNVSPNDEDDNCDDV